MQTIKLKINRKEKDKTIEYTSSVIKEVVPELEYYRFEELVEEKESNKEFTDFNLFINEFEDTILSPKTKPKNKKKFERPAYAIYFTIGNYNKPLEIDLSKIHRVELSTEEIQNQVQSAYDKGFEDGQQITQMALTEEFRKMEAWVKRIDEVISNLQQEFSLRIRSLKDIIVPIALKISEHIIKSELKTNPAIVEKQVEKSLEVIDNEKVFELRLNPSDVEILKSVGSILLSDPKLEGVEIVPDPSVEPGGCILETEVGRIDATISSQLKKVSNTLNNLSFDIEK